MPRDDPYFNDALFRQRERTIDNIKRVYAVVYSISFTNILKSIYDFFTDSYGRAGTDTEAFRQGMYARLLLLLIFISTVSVFAFQADKFLDLRYALRPLEGDRDAHGNRTRMPRWSALDFVIDAVSLVLTLIPFALMAYAFDSKLMHRAGVIGFALAYILLLLGSILFLAVVRLKYLLRLLFGASPPPAAGVGLSEETRYAALSVHWFLLNGATLIVLGMLFRRANNHAELCGAADMHGATGWFLLAFSGLALLRNYLDFSNVWPFLYMNSAAPDLSRKIWIMPWLIRQNFDGRITVADGLSLVVVAIAFAVTIGLLTNSLSTLFACPA